MLINRDEANKTIRSLHCVINLSFRPNLDLTVPLERNRIANVSKRVVAAVTGRKKGGSQKILFRFYIVSIPSYQATSQFDTFET